jgi:uncharacterized protein (TIGR03067 family)
MRAIMLGVLAAGLAAATAAAGGDAKKDAARLQGSWSVLHMEEAGKKAPDEIVKAMAVEIKGDKITVTEKGKVVVEFQFKLVPGKKPAEIDLKHLVGDDKGKTEKGIYEFEGDTARFCVADVGKERPKKFATSKDDERTLVVLKRKK